MEAWHGSSAWKRAELSTLHTGDGVKRSGHRQSVKAPALTLTDYRAGQRHLPGISRAGHTQRQR
jgi:hypothetical protein